MNKILLVALFLGVISCGLKDQVVSDQVELEVEIGGKVAGVLKIGLFGSVVPKTVANFVGICKGDKVSQNSGLPLSYAGTPFHRIIPNFMLQTGDFTMKNGRGGESIYGEKFQDENFDLQHEKFCLSMANAGPNTNGSQFFITVAETSWLDGRHVVFGRLMDEVSISLAKYIESLGTQNGTPKEEVNIKGCSIVSVM